MRPAPHILGHALAACLHPSPPFLYATATCPVSHPQACVPRITAVPSRRCQPGSDTLPVPRGILRHVKCRFLPVKKPLGRHAPVSCARATVLTPRRHATCHHAKLSVTLAPPSLHVRTTACPAINLRTKKDSPEACRASCPCDFKTVAICRCYCPVPVKPLSCLCQTEWQCAPAGWG